MGNYDDDFSLDMTPAETLIAAAGGASAPATTDSKFIQLLIDKGIIPLGKADPSYPILKTRIKPYLMPLAGMPDRDEVLAEVAEANWSQLESQAERSKQKGHGGNMLDELCPRKRTDANGKPYNWPIVQWVTDAIEICRQRQGIATARDMAKDMTPKQIFVTVGKLQAATVAAQTSGDAQAYLSAETTLSLYELGVQQWLLKASHEEVKELAWMLACWQVKHNDPRCRQWFVDMLRSVRTSMENVLKPLCRRDGKLVPELKAELDKSWHWYESRETLYDHLLGVAEELPIMK